MLIKYSHYQGQKSRDFLEYSLPWFMGSDEKAVDVCATPKTVTGKQPATESTQPATSKSCELVTATSLVGIKLKRATNARNHSTPLPDACCSWSS
jgi:hypothetical protein